MLSRDDDDNATTTYRGCSVQATFITQKLIADNNTNLETREHVKDAHDIVDAASQLGLRARVVAADEQRLFDHDQDRKSRKVTRKKENFFF